MIVNVNLMVANVLKIKGGIKICVDVSVKLQRKHQVYKKHYVWNPNKCACERNRYLKNIADDSVILCERTCFFNERFIAK